VCACRCGSHGRAAAGFPACWCCWQSDRPCVWCRLCCAAACL
jgi:hypothetical protein